MADTFTTTGMGTYFYIHPDVAVTAPSLVADRYLRGAGSTFLVDQSGQGLRTLSCTAHVDEDALAILKSAVGSQGTLTWIDGSWNVVFMSMKLGSYAYRGNNPATYVGNLDFLVVST